METEMAWTYMKGYIQALTDHFGYIRAEELLKKMVELEVVEDEK